MKIATLDIDNKAVVERWKKGETVFTIELGGLGPGYEQAIQNYLFDILTYLIEKKIDVKKLTLKKHYTKYYEEICSEVSNGRDLSGAMYGAAMVTAFQFYKYDYESMMRQVPDDRLIQVMNTQIKGE